MVYTMNTVLANLTILSLIFVGIIYFCISPQPISKSFISIQNYPCPQLYSMTVPTDELEAALNNASMANRSVIITVINKAYVEPHSETYPSMLDLFLESFWVGEDTRPLLDHLLFVAVDQTAYDRCKFRRLHCYRFETEGVDFTGEKLYMSDDFIKMMWRRTLFLLDVLRRGYNFIFTDTDIVWLRNPFPRLRSIIGNGSQDMLISTDEFNSPFSEIAINTGFYYVRSNNRTVALFETWYAMKDNFTGMKEQDVLVRLKTQGVFGQLGLQEKILDTLYFNGFCNKNNNFSAVVTIHANCCRSISAKVVDLMVVLHDWKKFKAASMATNETQSLQMFKPIACWNSWQEPKNKTLV